MTPAQQRWLEQHPNAKFYAHPETIKAIAEQLGASADGSLTLVETRIDSNAMVPPGEILAMDHGELFGYRLDIDPPKETA